MQNRSSFSSPGFPWRANTVFLNSVRYEDTEVLQGNFRSLPLAWRTLFWGTNYALTEATNASQVAEICCDRTNTYHRLVAVPFSSIDASTIWVPSLRSSSGLATCTKRSYWLNLYSQATTKIRSRLPSKSRGLFGVNALFISIEQPFFSLFFCTWFFMNFHFLGFVPRRRVLYPLRSLLKKALSSSHTMTVLVPLTLFRILRATWRRYLSTLMIAANEVTYQRYGSSQWA